MAQIDHKYPNMTLYLAKNSPVSHWISLVLAEKTISTNITFVDQKKLPNELVRINPHSILPFLIDQEGLRLYTPHIIVEYLDERFPHPPLLPIYPIIRAKCRQVVYQIAKEWYGLLNQIESERNTQEAVQWLQQGLLKFVPVFELKPYFLSDEFNLVDCCIAAVLFRLKQLGINIVNEIAPVAAYQKRLFEQPAFKKSLSQIKDYMTH